MRTTYGLLIVSLLLFVFGIWFVLAGVRAANAPLAAPPVATVLELMDGIVSPAAGVVYDSVATIVDKEGIHETRPKNDREWANVAGNAAALIEASELLKMEGRARDQADWLTISTAMGTAAAEIRAAAQKQDAEGILGGGERLNNSCDNCHRKYQVAVE
ncbi:MAG TPA: hypothetical protein VFD69_20695 [Vicinamibacterales bacterium]|nr:hypothetical protein [Vicinamibacterales bacterium]